MNVTELIQNSTYTQVVANKTAYGAEKAANPDINDIEKTEVDPFTALAIEEADHEIKYRTLSWQKTTLLLFGEYVCLAILALAWSWSVVGWVCGFFITFGLGIVTWCRSFSKRAKTITNSPVDTSYVLWKVNLVSHHFSESGADVDATGTTVLHEIPASEEHLRHCRIALPWYPKDSLRSYGHNVVTQQYLPQ